MKPIYLLGKCAAVATSVLLAGTYVCFRAGIVHFGSQPTGEPVQRQQVQHPDSEAKQLAIGERKEQTETKVSNIVVPPKSAPKLELGEHFPGSKSEIMISPKAVSPKYAIDAPSNVGDSFRDLASRQRSSKIPANNAETFKKELERVRAESARPFTPIGEEEEDSKLPSKEPSAKVVKDEPQKSVTGQIDIGFSDVYKTGMERATSGPAITPPPQRKELMSGSKSGEVDFDPPPPPAKVRREFMGGSKSAPVHFDRPPKQQSEARQSSDK